MSESALGDFGYTIVYSRKEDRSKNATLENGQHPLTINSLTAPGFGGRVYFPTIRDFIVLQVMPKAKAE